MPEIIPATLFEKLETEIRAKDAKGAKLLTDCYRRDDNAVPPIYELQPRGDNASWHEQVEKPLLAALKQASQNLGLNLEKEGVSIGASATEQEIIEGALKVPDAATHVRAFFRTIEGLPNPAPDDYVETGEAVNRLKQLKERIGGHIDEGKVCRYRIPWRVEGKFTDDDLKEFCEQAWKQLSAVVEQQIAALAKVPPDEQEEQAHQDFGKERCRYFVGRAEPLERIANYLPEGSGKPLAVIGPSGSGKSAVMAKAVEKVTSGWWRVASDTPGLICRFIGATPASSDLVQLLRNLVAEIRRRYPAPMATEPASREGEKAKPNDSEIPFEYSPLINAFHEVLKRPTAERPLFLFIDALDQLTTSHNAHSLTWLPGSLTSHVRLIVSAAMPNVGWDGSPSRSSEREGPKDARAERPYQADDPRVTIMAALTSRLDAEHRITLTPLTAADGEQMLTNWLADAHRTLHSAQRQAILETFKVEGSPLWLRTATEESARLASWQIAPSFAPTTLGLLGQVLARLSREEEHGDKLVSRTLSYMACARHGLAEDEILDILSTDKEVMADFRRRSPNSPQVDSLPLAVWVRLHGDLAFYLAEHHAQGASLLGFYHRSFLEAVTAHCFAPRETRETRHQHLSIYFLACAKGLDPAKEWETDAVRGFAECVFHLVKAGQHGRAAGLLSNFPFLLHKLCMGLLQGVFEDYEMLRSEASAEVVKGFEIWADFFSEKAHILRRGNEEWPTHKILLQLAVEHADASPLTHDAEQWLEEDRCDWFWLRRVPRLAQAQNNTCRAVFEGHTGPVRGALMLTDDRLLSWSGGFLPATDSALRLWDCKSGACLTVFDGHADGFAGVLALSEERFLSWSRRFCSKLHTLQIWDYYSGACLMILEGHTSKIGGALELRDRHVVSWSGDGTLRLWDSQKGDCLAEFRGHTDEVNGALELGDGRLLSWSSDGTLRLWDSLSGVCLCVLKGHTRNVHGALALADGRLLSWSGDGTLRLWDSHSGHCMLTLTGHPGWVRGALVLADGQLLSWSGSTVSDKQDNMLRLWDCQSGACLAVLEGHTAEIYGALELRNTQLLSWGMDKTLRLWDRHTRSCRAVFTGHTGEVKGALELADGRLLSWSSDHAPRLWDAQSGTCITAFTGHTQEVFGMIQVGGGRTISWSMDETLRLWDCESIECQQVEAGYTSSGVDVMQVSDGRLVSFSVLRGLPLKHVEINMFQLWDSQTGACLAVLDRLWVSGVLALSDGRLLSWLGKELRVWNGHNGKCLAVLEGHNHLVRGALELSHGRLLSWSDGDSFRLWDRQTGECLRTLTTHASSPVGAMELSDGRLLTWSDDATLRLLDSYGGKCLAVLEGHTRAVKGALELSNKRILSWTDSKTDATIRLWDSKNGMHLSALKGHTDKIIMVMVLTAERLLSWSKDRTLRVWDSQNGECLALLKGHASEIKGALEMSNGLILSWSDDGIWRLWKYQNGECFEGVPEDQITTQHPDWLHSRVKSQEPRRVYLDFFAYSKKRTPQLRHRTISPLLAAWNADSTASVRCLLADGTLAVTQSTGQVCILKLHYGNRRVSLAEAETILEKRVVAERKA